MTTLAHSRLSASLSSPDARAQYSLAPGEVMLVVVDSNGAANVWRLVDLPGATAVAQAAWAIAAGETQAIGPFSLATTVEVHALTPTVTVEIGRPDSVELPSGGAAYAQLRKKSATDWDVEWAQFVPLSYSTEERDALDPLPAEGTVIYNTTTHKLNVMTDGGWEEVTSTVEGS